MKFNIEADSGAYIRGWLQLDDRYQIPRLHALLASGDRFEFAATVPRADFVDLESNCNPVIGFELDDALIPGLAGEVDLEIRELQSQLPIYRRFNPARQISCKLLLVEGSIIPFTRSTDGIKRAFTLPYAENQSLTQETIDTIAGIGYSSSILMTGRAQVSPHLARFKQAGFLSACLLRDPFEQLAEKLLFANHLQRHAAAALAPFATGLAPLGDFVRDFNFDEDWMDVAFRRATVTHKTLLRDTLVRMLGCDGDEKITRMAVSRALENLSEMDVVGTRERFGEFRTMLDACLGMDVLDAPPEAPPAVREIGLRLSRIGIVQDLLENDLTVHRYVIEALDTAQVALGRPSPAEKG